MRRSTRRQEWGFTAIELLVVLAILALLGTIAAVFFRRQVLNERVEEATAMLSELASKQQAFRAGGGRYIPLRADGRVAMPSADEDPEAFYPLPADSPRLASARTPARVEDRSWWPTGWRTIGVVPRRDILYCTYLVNAGERGRPDPALRFGSALVPKESDEPWFYALAVCNFEGAANYPDGVTVYGVSSQDGRVRTFNEGR